MTLKRIAALSGIACAGTALVCWLVLRWQEEHTLRDEATGEWVSEGEWKSRIDQRRMDNGMPPMLTTNR